MSITSSEIASIELPSLSAGPSCQVCGQNSHGTHFGVITCRACAAFFRRVAAGANFLIKPCKTDGKCEVITNGRSCCKKCRLKKCVQVGMTITNFQFGRDSVKSSQNTPSLSVTVGVAEMLIFRNPEATSNSTFINVSDLLKKAKHMIKHRREISLTCRKNRLRKLADSMNPHSPELQCTLIRTVGFRETCIFWEHDLVTVTTWLTNFDEFRGLKLEVKLTFLKAIWIVWNRLEKLIRSARALQHRPDYWDPASIFITTDCILNVRQMTLDIDWLTKYSVQRVAYFIEGVGDWSLFSTLEPILDLNPDDIEVNYMLAHVSFTYVAKKLGKEYAEIAENLLDLLANDLHNYYKETGKLRYSERITKMMKIDNLMLKILRERKEKLKIAKTFDIFHAEFSEPEMFDGIL